MVLCQVAKLTTTPNHAKIQGRNSWKNKFGNPLSHLEWPLQVCIKEELVVGCLSWCHFPQVGCFGDSHTEADGSTENLVESGFFL